PSRISAGTPRWTSRSSVPSPSGASVTSTTLGAGGAGVSRIHAHVKTTRWGGAISTYSPRATSPRPVTSMRKWPPGRASSSALLLPDQTKDLLTPRLRDCLQERFLHAQSVANRLRIRQVTNGRGWWRSRSPQSDRERDAGRQEAAQGFSVRVRHWPWVERPEP